MAMDTAPDQIRQRLRSRKTEDRIQAVTQAAALEAGQRQALLLEALVDRSSYVAALAAEALGAGADDRAALAMMERFGVLCVRWAHQRSWVPDTGQSCLRPGAAGTSSGGEHAARRHPHRPD